MRRTIVILTVLLVALGVAGPVAAQTEDPPGPKGKLEGEVVAVRAQARVHNQGEVTEIQVRTRTQEHYWLQLGPAEQYGNAVQVGDRVRLRVMAGAEGEPAMVQSMFNYRNGARLRIRDGSGEMIQQRLRDQTGTGIQAQEKEQEQHRRGDTQGTARQNGGTRGGGGGSNGGGGKGGGR